MDPTNMPPRRSHIDPWNTAIASKLKFVTEEDRKTLRVVGAAKDQLELFQVPETNPAALEKMNEDGEDEQEVVQVNDDLFLPQAEERKTRQGW